MDSFLELLTAIEGQQGYFRKVFLRQFFTTGCIISEKSLVF